MMSLLNLQSPGRQNLQWPAAQLAVVQDMHCHTLQLHGLLLLALLPTAETVEYTHPSKLAREFMHGRPEVQSTLGWL